MEKIDPLLKKNANIWAKNGPFFPKSRTCRLYKNRPFLSEIQNDDAYPLPTGVAGPGLQSIEWGYRVPLPLPLTFRSGPGERMLGKVGLLKSPVLSSCHDGR